MALSLFCINKCQFDNCGLYFATLSDLIQHIEETHLPIFEAERKKREEERALLLQTPPDGVAKNLPVVGPAVPLSSIYRLFPVLPPHKAQPIKYEPTKISFFHYRKKQVALPAVGSVHYAQPSIINKSRTTSRSEHDEELSNDSFRTNEDDGDAYEPNDERRHKCPVEGCNKRYKNLQGARYHARTIHGLNEDNSVPVPLEPLMMSTESQSPNPQSQAPISKAAAVRPHKCPHCSKRYKTISNLNKHVQETHQRVNQNYTNQNMTSNLAPVSSVAAVNSIPSPHFQNSSSSDSVMVQVSTQTQIPVGAVSNHFASNSLPGLRVTAQPPQPTTSSLNSYQFQQQGSYSSSPTTPNVQVRAASTGAAPRLSSNLGSVITYDSMIEGSQQTDSSMHVMPQKQVQKISSAPTSSMPNHTPYVNNNP